MSAASRQGTSLRFLRSSSALLVRSLRVDSRSMWSHLARFVCAASLLVGLIGTQTTAESQSAPGLALFKSICGINFLMILLGAFSYFASAITEEKEDGTLGLLRMANIGPLGLLLGKSTTRLIAALLILAVQFPFTMLAITLGGLTWSQVAAAYVALAAYMAFVANVGLFASVVCRQTSGAVLLVAVLLILHHAGPVTVMALLTDGDQWAHMAEAMLPYFRTIVPVDLHLPGDGILAPGFSGAIFSTSVLINLGSAAALFLLSWLTFDTFTRHHLVVEAPRLTVEHSTTLLPTFRAGRCWRWAIGWKEFQFGSGGLLILTFKTIGVGVLILMTLLLTSRNEWPEAAQVGFVIIGVALTLGALELVLIANRVFENEIRWQTWPLLCILPRPLWRTVLAKMAGALIGMLPLAFYLILGVILRPDSGRELFTFLTNVNFMSGDVTPWVFITQYLLFLELVLFLSLYVRWWAVPAAIVSQSVLTICIMPLMVGAQSGTPFLIAFDVLTLLLAVMTYFRLQWYGEQS